MDTKSTTYFDPPSCLRCHQPLSRYTTGDLCNICATTAPAVALPLEFWFDPEVSAALETWKWSTVLRAVWKATGATQDAIADQTKLTQATISRLMSGRSGGQTIETALKLVDGLGAPRILAGLAPQGLRHLAQTAHGEPEPGGEPDTAFGGEEPAVKRREFGSTVLLVGLSAAIPDTGDTGKPPQVNDVLARLNRPSEIAADLYKLDDTYGGASLVELATARLASLKAQVRRASLAPSRERLAVSVAGELEVCAGWFSFEAGNHKQAAQHYSQALYAAHESGNDAVRLHVLNLMAMLAINGRSPDKAHQIAATALDTAPHGDPRLRSLLTMRKAHAAAKVARAAGQGRSPDFERHLGAAWDELGGNGPIEQEPWFAFFSERELRGLEALGRGWLGQHERSAEILADAIPGMLPRNSAYYSLDHASALVSLGEVEQGVAKFHEILPMLMELSSVRVRNGIGEFAQTLTPHARHDADAAETRRIALHLAGQGRTPT
ncbi:hypothetical protein J4573_31495 [Actinomadura barringtoniae]|uniref:HTH cro/C1-type domain-containing protein n=1 Tax=Actinomadura barringtoniae TaxID=1427535 RepID=A0A939PG64_9ACTN|nr:helix-turn-helix transcriptional regulator [Actinomadura barringtoniae]MBO2451652.1 hypothetical protein [Actinomadura barringtoniae]